MYTDTRKIHIIEAILKTDDEATLSIIENAIKQPEKKGRKKTAKDFAGIWSKEDAEAIEKAIEEGCEQINPDTGPRPSRRAR